MQTSFLFLVSLTIARGSGKDLLVYSEIWFTLIPKVIPINAAQYWLYCLELTLMNKAEFACGQDQIQGFFDLLVIIGRHCLQ